MPIEYAHALNRSLADVTTKEAAHARVEGLVDALVRAGKTDALPAVLREFERIASQKTARTPQLAVAKESDAQNALHELAAHYTHADTAHTTIITDENLVGGWRYIDSDTLIDTSYKAALLELYRRVTSL